MVGEEEMLIRHWDPEKRFEGAVIKIYEHWVLEVSWQQHTLACFILFCRHEKIRLQSELSDGALRDLRRAMREIEVGLRKSPFAPDHFNYLQMGNALPLLHFHGVPRYDSNRDLSKELLGREVTDENPGHFTPWSREKITSEQMGRIHQLMQESLQYVCPADLKIAATVAPHENPFYAGLRKAMEIP